MGRKEKLIRKLKSNPRDLTFEEAESLLAYLNFYRSDKGRTSGSRVIFASVEHGIILLHRPHPRKDCSSIRSSNCAKNWNRRD